MTAAERKSLCSVDAAALKAEAADLSARMEKGVRVCLWNFIIRSSHVITLPAKMYAQSLPDNKLS